MHQPPLHQGSSMPISTYAPPAVPQPQTRQFYPGATPRGGPHPRGHLPRPASMVVQVPNLPPYVQGGQMYPPSHQVMASNMQFVLQNQHIPYSQCDGLQLQSGRHHNHATTASAPPPTSNYITTPYGHTPQSIHIMAPYNHLYLAPPPPLRNSQFPPTVTTGNSQPPPTQQQAMNQSGGVVGGGGAGGSMGVATDAGSRNSQKRKNALKIINPTTGRDVVEEMQSEENASQSSESSASHTPQPQNTGETNLHVVAEFAAAIAKVATEEGHHGEGVANGPHQDGHHHHPQQHHHVPSPPHTHRIQEPPSLHQGKPSEQQSKPPAVVAAPEPAPLIKETPVVSALTNSPPVDVVHHHRAVQPSPAPTKRHQSPPSSSSSTSSLSSLGGSKTQPPQQPQSPVPPHPEPPVTKKIQEKKEDKKPAPKEEPVPPKVPKQSSFSNAYNVKNILVGAPGSNSLSLQQQQPQQPPQQQQPQIPDDKQTNGEALTEPQPSTIVSHHHHESAGGKASQRPKSKKQQKLKDLNRKGVEKEGSDMDAFTELAPVSDVTPSPPPQQQQQREASPMLADKSKEKEQSKSEEKENRLVQEPAQKQEPPQQKEKSPVPVLAAPSAPPVTSSSGAQGGGGPYIPPSRSRAAAAAEAAKQQLQEKSQPPPSPTPVEQEVNDKHEDVETTANEEEESPAGVTAIAGEEDDDADTGSSDDGISKTVAAKNEENAKLSGQNPVGVIETQIIERSTPAAPPPSQLQLKYEYKNGQWSPLNREGKKMYDRDLLMAIRNDPLSYKKPDINLDCEIFVKDKDVSSNNNNNARRNVYSSSFSTSSSMNMGGSSNFVPNFMRSSSSQRGMPKRNSQQGRTNQMRSKGIHMTNSLKDDVKLRESENAWKPGRFSAAVEYSEDQIKSDALYKKVRGILNKLTPQKFDTLVKQFQDLDIDSYERLVGVIDLVFEKAVDEPSFSKAYAEMCRILARLQVLQKPAEPGQEQTMVNFRKLLISRCQAEFEKNKVAELDVERRMTEIKATKDPEKKKELQLLFEEEERKIRVRSVGLVRFIGELFKLSMLTTNIMHNCVRTLIVKIDEEPLECLCKLLMTIGKELEEQSHSDPKFEKDWNGYFDRMAKLAVKREDSKVSSRVRFMLQDVMELRANKWVPRRDENNPKTIDQIQKDAERETMEKAALLAASVPTKRHDNRDRDRDDRRRNMRGNNTQSEDGWQNVPSKFSSRSNYPIELAKLQQMKNTDHENVLGSANQFRDWGSGSGAGVKRDPHPKTSFTDSNSYALLALQEDRKSQSVMSGRGLNKLAPSPSLEKERAFQGVKDVMLDSKNSRSMNSGGGRGSTSGPPSRDNSRARYHGGRPSGSSAAPAPPASTPPTPRSAPPPEQAPPVKIMSDSEAERKTKTLIEEFKSLKNIEETTQSCKEMFPGENINKFLRNALNSVLDQSLAARTSCADLIGHLATNNIVQTQNIVKEFAEIFSLAEDLVIDMPQLWTYLAELLAPIFSHEVLNFADIKTMAEALPDKTGLSQVLLGIFELLSADKGPAFVSNMWNSSKVQLKDFMTEEKVDAFIKNEKVSRILFMQGGQACPEQGDQVEEQLYNFLMSDNERVFDQICDWTNTTLGNRAKDAKFIRTLTRAVIRASIKNGKLTPSFQKHEKLIKRFVDTKEELELACLYGIQHLIVTDMEAPQGLLQSIFQALYDDGTISYEGFQKWKNPGREETKYEAEGKGVATMSLSTFFVSLSEMDEGDDDSS